MGDKMNNSLWEEIEEFDGWADYDKFIAWINKQIIEGIATEIPMARPYNAVCKLEEKWYLHKASGQKWRLVKPEPPFPGLFQIVE